MLERLNPYLRALCFVLGALLVLQAGRVALSRNKRLPDFVANGPALTGATTRAASPPAARSDLPPEITLRVEKIKESQILGQVMRPPPMAVIGIAGNEVLLRTDTGQTGWVAEGAELGGVKIVKIGTNRVLIEQRGETKELTLFQGFGGESLLSRGKAK